MEMAELDVHLRREKEQEMVHENAAEAVAKEVLKAYDSLPPNGKPLHNQFTVLAGIVAIVKLNGGGSEFLCLSLATGTKCLGDKAPLSFPGCTLSDSHAEVLCKRAFNRFLLLSIQRIQMEPSYQFDHKCPVEIVDVNGSGRTQDNCRIKHNWELWMYISDSPCGDASIYERKGEKASYTGQKTFCLESSSESSLLRTKPARKDILSHLRSSSMSCSDKLSRWACLGLQGGLLAFFLKEPAYLTGLVVGSDKGACEGEQLKALHRCITNRISKAFRLTDHHTPGGDILPVIPHIFLSPSVFSSGKSYTESITENSKLDTVDSVSSGCTTNIETQYKDAKKTRKLKKFKPSGNNLNWLLCPGLPENSKAQMNVEVTLSATGILQGCTATTLLQAKRDGSNGKCGSARPERQAKSLKTDNCSDVTDSMKGSQYQCDDFTLQMPFQSRLCQREFFNLFRNILKDLPDKKEITQEHGNGASYTFCKKLCKAHQARRDKFLQNAEFCGWLHKKMTDAGGNEALA